MHGLWSILGMGLPVTIARRIRKDAAKLALESESMHLKSIHGEVCPGCRLVAAAAELLMAAKLVDAIEGTAEVTS